MITIIRAFALILCLTGYILFLYKKGIPAALAPILTVSGISVLLFLAGILNLMFFAGRTLFFLGLLLSLLAFYRTSLKTFLKKDLIAVVVFFLILNGFFFLRLRNVQITSYDNFSHWMLVVKDMLRVDRLPNFASSLVQFQAYPTGTAGFIYFVCLCIGDAEGCMLFGQAIILTACLCIFWLFVKKSYLFSGVLISIFSLYLLVVCISISDLCVDTVLSLVSIASFACLIYYRNDYVKAAVSAGIIGCFLMLVKNSGIFYVLLHGVLLISFYLYDVRKKKTAFSWKQTATLAGYAIGAPLLTILLWNRHVDYAFYAAEFSKHSMSVENYTAVLGDKSAEQIREILELYWTRLMNPGGEIKVLSILAAAYLALFLFGRLCNSGRASSIAFYFGWSIFTYVCYLVGIAAMYLISMPYGEAMMLGSFDRYLATHTMYLVGICTIYLLQELSLSSRTISYVSIVSPIVALSLLYTMWGRLPSFFIDKTDFASTPRGILQSIHYEYNIPFAQRYYITGPYDYGYLYYMSQYEFWSPHVTVQEELDASEYDDFFNTFDYLIIAEEIEGTDEFLKAVGLPAGQIVYNLSDYR